MRRLFLSSFFHLLVVNIRFVAATNSDSSVVFSASALLDTTTSSTKNRPSTAPITTQEQVRTSELSWPPLEAPDCASHASCDQCYNASYFCHWCAGPDGTDTGGSCHARGAGCVVGKSCGDANVNATCAAQPDCKTCTAASNFCHWCGEGSGCHALGSIYGCGISVNCMANTECLRKTPQFIGFSYAPAGVYILVFGILGLLICLGGCVQCICYRVYKSVKAARAEIEQSYEQARELRGVADDNGNGRNGGAEQESGTESDASPPQVVQAMPLDPAEARPALWARLTDRFVGGCFRNTCRRSYAGKGKHM